MAAVQRGKVTFARLQKKSLLRIAGILSPYIAFIVFVPRGHPIAAILFYHITLLLCILGIEGPDAFRRLARGFGPRIGPLICVGGCVPGFVIFYLWAIARQDSVDLANVFTSLHLSGPLFAIFATYSCLINPVLEESFWRGCFDNLSRLPNRIDALFAGYHAMAVIPVVKPVFVLLTFLSMVFVGWLFRTLYRRTGGLLIPYITHLIADIAILYAVWRLIQ